ncbi:hypothetical protein [Sphingomonas yantingensis]|uniref:Uncharacterized protein n=1 Tax=Sphingomonas yantingensis TaxID=1241761 RepID=A0A7W9AT05_9SPHN|nr:hypothetical protein [Sphingomonas yantingensis]MBB5700022.1 hypothetical protein [Sphingomonas yantingensis]
MADAQSDLVYVQGDGVRVRVNPMIDVNIGKWTDRSGSIAVANTPQPLFEQVDEKVLSRFVVHAGDAGTLHVNFLGGNAVKNAPGSVPLKPGAVLRIPTRGPVSIAGDSVGIPYTAAEA